MQATTEPTVVFGTGVCETRSYPKDKEVQTWSSHSRKILSDGTLVCCEEGELTYLPKTYSEDPSKKGAYRRETTRNSFVRLTAYAQHNGFAEVNAENFLNFEKVYNKYSDPDTESWSVALEYQKKMFTRTHPKKNNN
jgi:hypothetical protein